MLLALPGVASAVIAQGDFDGNGFSDLVVGVPGEDIGDVPTAGSVSVIYGSGVGLNTGPNDQVWHQDSDGIRGRAEPGDRFGSALAAGDFNSDGYADLAVGVPLEDVHNVTEDFNAVNGGAVNVIYGSEDGLSEVLDQLITEEMSGLDLVFRVWPGNKFGEALAAGDFDNDDYDDLAVGIPGASAPDDSYKHQGAVGVLYGYFAGLGPGGEDQWPYFAQNNTNVPGKGEAGDRFGEVLAVGKLDGYFDGVAVGVPREDIGNLANAGTVMFLYGGNYYGLHGDGEDEELWQSAPGVGGDSEPGDQFGATVATGDFDGDTTADLAVGAPSENIGNISDAGAVNVFYSESLYGPSAAGDQLFTQDTVNVNESDPEDEFGAAVATGDFDGDTNADVAIGVPREDIYITDDVGMVRVLYGGDGGLSTAGRQTFSQKTNGIRGEAEPYDHFAWALAAGDFADYDDSADLAIGVPHEDIGNSDDAGAVNVILGGEGDGLSEAADQLFHQGMPEIGGGAAPSDLFGDALASR